MDINYLLLREQVERARAEQAAGEAARRAHRELADGYRAMVDNFRRSRLSAVGLAPSLRPPAL